MPRITSILRDPDIGNTATSSETSSNVSSARGDDVRQIQESSTDGASSEPIWHPQEPYRGIWILKDELALLPTSGPAWDQLWEAANEDPGAPLARDQDQMSNVYVLAKSTVYSLVKKGRIPFIKIGKNVRIRQSDLMNWLEEQTRP